MEQAARQSATVAERLTPQQVDVGIDHYSAGIMAYESQMMANFIQYHDQGGLEAVTAAKRIDGIALRELWAGACKIKEHHEGSNKFVAKLDVHLTRILRCATRLSVRCSADVQRDGGGGDGSPQGLFSNALVALSSRDAKSLLWLLGRSRDTVVV